jgi:hypothetical protein
MTTQQIQSWIEYVSRKYDHLIQSEQIFDPDLEDVPSAEKIIIRTWDWTDPDGVIHALLDMDGHMEDLYDSVVLFDNQPLCDNQDGDDTTLYWREDPFPGFNLDLFNAIRTYLVDASFNGLGRCIAFDQVDEAGIDFLRARPEFVQMEKDGTMN